MKIFSVVLFFCAIVLAAPARASRFDEPFPLGKLDLQSSLIVKATALESEPIRDDLTGAPIKMTDGPYAATVTRFKVISVLKGKLTPGEEINFRHYSFNPAFRGGWSYSLRTYSFIAGRTYLLWANRDGENWQSFSSYGSSFGEQGALLSADDAPVEGAVRDVVWNQIQGLLKSQKTGEVTRGLRYLALMRRRDAKTYETTGDYSNDQVAETLRPFLSSSDTDVAVYAMRVAKFDAPRFAAELLVNSHADEPRVRAAALDALSKVVTPDSETRIRAAVSDRSPDVAAVALRSLAAFPDDATRATWKRWAGSDEPARRIGVAQGIARAHDKQMLPTLQTLAHDADKKVSNAASTALWMYSEPNTRFIEGF